MGVPKVIDFWVESMSIILAGMAKGIVDLDEVEYAGITYKNENGKEVEDTVYRGITILNGKEVNDWVMKLNSLSDIKSLLDNDNFKQFPLYQPAIRLKLLFIPNDLYKKEMRGSDRLRIEASHNYNTEENSVKKIGSSTIFVKQIFDFEVTLPVSELDNLNIDKLRKQLKPVIGHELTHAYETFNRMIRSGDPYQGREAILNAATRFIDDFKYPLWNKFLHIIYLHLSFEINARITEFYYELKNNDITTQEEFLNLLKNSKVWEEIKMLEDFNAEEFIKNFKVKSGLSISDYWKDEETQKEREQQGLQRINLMKTPNESMVHLIYRWNSLLQYLNTEIQKQGIYKGKLMDLVPKKALENPTDFFKFFEDRFHKKAEKFKRRLYKLSSLVLDENIGNI